MCNNTKKRLICKFSLKIQSAFDWNLNALQVAGQLEDYFLLLHSGPFRFWLKYLIGRNQIVSTPWSDQLFIVYCALFQLEI